jgi:20S proteasome alpha/beta subunit
MTIALGMLCGGGVIIAADRRRSLEDGTATLVNKIHKSDGDNIGFAIADASNDANAAGTLVRKIASRLANANNWIDIEPLVSGAMTEWYVPFTQAPTVYLILAIVLKGFGVQLYLCEPPNSVVPKPEGYAAAGLGAAVTDPLNNTLFNPAPQSRHPQMVLRQIVYLMYRAKKDNTFCGGPTDAVYIDSVKGTVEWVDAFNMRDAERASFQLDIILNAQAITPPTLTDARFRTLTLRPQ